MNREKRRVGRPTVEPRPGERIPVSLRVTPELKRKLDEMATYNGRSQAQEAEFRLERSFAREDLLVDALYLRYSPEVAGIVLAVGEIMNVTGCAYMGYIGRIRKHDTPTFHDAFDPVERRWATYPPALEMGLAAGVALLAMLRPNPKGGKAVTKQERRLAIETAAGFLQAIAKGPCKDEPTVYRKRREIICSLLGPTIVEEIKRRSSSAFEDFEQVFRAPFAGQDQPKGDSDE